MNRLVIALVAALGAIFPASAGADYLYSMLPVERQPRVLFLVDNSNNLDSYELAVIKSELRGLLPRLDGVAAGFARYGATGTTAWCQHDTSLATYTASRSAAETWVNGMTSGGPQNVAGALRTTAAQIVATAKNDKSVACRPYVVILLTGGRNNRCSGNNSGDDIRAAVSALRTLTASGNTPLDVRTFVVHYGDGDLLTTDPDTGEVISGIAFWDGIARRGGRSRLSDGSICDTTGTSACPSGSAFYATNSATLRSTFNRILSKVLEGEYSAIAPVIGTAAQVDSEVNRVARNFMAYSSFRMPGSEGHLYGIRLFVEESPRSGKWQFTNFFDLDLDSCGEPDNPCVFDAGRKLVSRVGARNIFTSVSADPVFRQEGGLNVGVTLPLQGVRMPLSADGSGSENLKDAWNRFLQLADAHSSGLSWNLPPNTLDMGEATTAGSTHRVEVINWLQGTTRQWPLGDLYHSGATIIGGAGYAYRTRGYPDFARKVRNRPHMIYVGANDGMLHAFHAAPKLSYQDADATITAEWEAGDEAWAYLPVSMLPRAASAIRGGENRFFSMDLSCRVDDVLTYDNLTSGVLDCGEDPYCGWRTILLCGQGWGGSWYVAVDVTDPLDPKPLWESTYTGTKGMGRTWSVPGIALVNDAGMPRWLGVTGNGYNAGMQCAGVTCSSKREAFRLLNLPFDGHYPEHGNGAGDESAGRLFVFDMATGTFVHVDDGVSGPVVADTPIVDANRDGWSDSVLAGTWRSQLDQLLLGSDSTTGKTTFAMCKGVGAFSGGTNKPITSRPSALPSIQTPGKIHAFVGSGVDGGSYPDEQGSSGNQYAFEIFDLNGTSCTTNPASNLCSDTRGVTLKNIFTNGTRLVGSPLFVLRKDGERWLTFTSWLPPSVNQPCDESEATLRCLETSGHTRCRACGDLDGDGIEDSQTDLDTGGRQPTSPTSADGQLYVTTPYGPVRVSNQSGEGGGVAGGLPQPNQGAPSSSLILGWREIFE